MPSETGALKRERALKASVARRSIAALRVSEGAEAFLRPAALGSACAACCSVCAVGPLPWCCFLRRPLLHLRSLRSLVRRCEKMSIRLLTGAGAAASAGTFGQKFGCYKAPYWRSSPSSLCRHALVGSGFREMNRHLQTSLASFDRRSPTESFFRLRPSRDESSRTPLNVGRGGAGARGHRRCSS